LLGFISDVGGAPKPVKDRRPHRVGRCGTPGPPLIFGLPHLLALSWPNSL
jgi:hypothetical protein